MLRDFEEAHIVDCRGKPQIAGATERCIKIFHYSELADGNTRGVLEIDPFPLAGATTFRLSGRKVPERRFESDADLAVELASARWQEWTACRRWASEPNRAL